MTDKVKHKSSLNAGDGDDGDGGGDDDNNNNKIETHFRCN